MLPSHRPFNALKDAAREVGSIQIQNRGTVAGNLCNASPAADGVPPLLVLDAEVELLSHVGRRQIPLHEFLVGNRKTKRRSDELLTAVLIRNAPGNARSVFTYGAGNWTITGLTLSLASNSALKARFRTITSSTPSMPAVLALTGCLITVGRKAQAAATASRVIPPPAR